MSESDWEQHKDKLMFARWDAWLDGKPSVQHLAIPELAKCIQRSIYHFAEARYHVVAYAVMPSHLHWVFHPTPAWCEEIARITSRVARQRTPRELIMHSFKSFTAHECNLALQQTGAFWQAESYDHWARDHDELQRIIDYVEQNPVKARLAGVADSFVYSSAYDRKLWGIARGDPLIPPKDLLHPWAIPRLP